MMCSDALRNQCPVFIDGSTSGTSRLIFAHVTTVNGLKLQARATSVPMPAARNGFVIQRKRSAFFDARPATGSDLICSTVITS